MHTDRPRKEKGAKGKGKGKSKPGDGVAPGKGKGKHAKGAQPKRAGRPEAQGWSPRSVVCLPLFIGRLMVLWCFNLLVCFYVVLFVCFLVETSCTYVIFVPLGRLRDWLLSPHRGSVFFCSNWLHY